jgi:hypothetical protein
VIKGAFAAANKVIGGGSLAYVVVVLETEVNGFLIGNSKSSARDVRGMPDLGRLTNGKWVRPEIGSRAVAIVRETIDLACFSENL